MGHISARNTYWKELEYDSLLHYLGIFMYMESISFQTIKCIGIKNYGIQNVCMKHVS